MYPSPPSLRRLYSVMTAIVAIIMLFAADVPAQKRISQSGWNGAQPVRLGESVTGTLGAGRSDRYELTIGTTTSVAIRMDKVLGSSVDPKVTVLNSSGAEIGSDDDGGEGLNSLLVLMLAPGRYTIVAEAVGSSSGDYALRVDEQSSAMIQLGTAVISQFGGGYGSPQQFSVVIPVRTELRIRMEKILGSEVDPKIRLLDDTGAEVGSDDDGGEGLNSLLQIWVNAGRYTVMADRVGSGDGRYLLTVYDARAGLAGDPFPVGTAERGSVTDPRLPTRLRLAIEEQLADVRISANPVGGGLDPVLVVLDDQGNVVASDDDGGDGRSAMARVQLPHGEYEVLVGGYGETTGSFSLLIERDELPSVELGDYIRGSISAGGRDLYRLQVAQSSDMVFSVEKVGESDLDPKVTLLDASGAEVASDDDGGEGNNALLTHRVDRGTYTVAITGYGTTSGSYLLGVTEPAVRDMGVIVVGDARPGRIDEAGERHRYRLSVSEAGPVSIDLAKTSGSDLDPELILRDSSGRQLATNDDGGDGLNSRISRRLSAGDYEIVAVGHNGSTGGYTLTANVQMSEALEVGMRRLASIDVAGEEDRYAYVADGRETVVVRVEKVFDSQIDPKVAIYDANGSEVASDDDGGDGLNSRLTQTLASGSYDIVVGGVGSSTGDYVLSVERVVAAGSAAVKSVALGSRNLGRILSEGQEDRYAVTVGERMDILISADALGGTGLDPQVTLATADGDEVATDDDGGEGLNAMIRRSVPPGEYIVTLRSYGTSQGEYILRIERDDVAVQDLGRISGERSLSGSIDESGERDVYDFSVPERTFLSISLTASGDEFDPYLEVFDTDGAEVASNDDASGRNSLIAQEFAEGDYRLVARGYSGSTGGYELGFMLGERTTTETDRGTLSVGAQVTGELAGGVAATADVWRLNVEQAAQLEITARKPEGSEIDPFLEVRDAKGDVIDSNDDGGDGLNALVRRQFSPGEYLVVVSGFSGTSGEYSLEASPIREPGRIISFEEDDAGFGTASDSRSERGLAIGKYSIRAIQGDVVAFSNSLGEFSDGTYRVSTLKVEGADRKGFGLAIRVHGDSDRPDMYLFEIGTDGRYRFRKREGGDWSSVVDWTETSAVAKGSYAQNALRIDAQGSRFIVYVNGTHVGEASDTAFSSGSVGLYASEGLYVLFDNLETPAPAPGRIQGK